MCRAMSFVWMSLVAGTDCRPWHSARITPFAHMPLLFVDIGHHVEHCHNESLNQQPAILCESCRRVDARRASKRTDQRCRGMVVVAVPAQRSLFGLAHFREGGSLLLWCLGGWGCRELKRVELPATTRARLSCCCNARRDIV